MLKNLESVSSSSSQLLLSEEGVESFSSTFSSYTNGACLLWNCTCRFPANFPLGEQSQPAPSIIGVSYCILQAIRLSESFAISSISPFSNSEFLEFTRSKNFEYISFCSLSANSESATLLQWSYKFLSASLTLTSFIKIGSKSRTPDIQESLRLI